MSMQKPQLSRSNSLKEIIIHRTTSYCVNPAKNLLQKVTSFFSSMGNYAAAGILSFVNYDVFQLDDFSSSDDENNDYIDLEKQ